VIHVTHDSNHWRTWLQFSIGMHLTDIEQRFRIIELGRMRDVAHFFDHDHRGFLIKHLVDGDHLTQFHQLLDHLGSLDCHFVRQIGYGDGFRHMNFAHDGFSRLLEIRFTILIM